MKERELLLKVSKIIYQTVEEWNTAHGSPCPTTPIFLACAQHGCTEAYFDALIDALEQLGVLRRDAHSLYPVRDIAQRLGFAA